MDVFINLQLTENGCLLWPFTGNFHEISAKNHCDWRQNNSEQKSASVTLYNHLTYFKVDRNYFENIYPKDRAKRLSFLKCRKLSISGTKTTMVFCISKTHQKKHVGVVPILRPSKLYQKITSK